MQRILVVVTSHSELGSTGRPTGYYLDEVAIPYYAFIEKGFDVDFASPLGGAAPVDPGSLSAADDPTSPAARFRADEDAQDLMASTGRLADVDPSAYAAVFVAGGHGAMWDLPFDADLARVVAAIDAAAGVVSAVCHGPAGLVGATRSDGSPVVSGRRVAVFTDAEEAAAGLTEVVPFLLESRFRELGASVVAAPLWADNAVRDGNLVTGQNPASAGSVAALVLEAVGL
ncbi:MAG: type 1 glutamine amidotransferase domain-containing protein [Actinomycetota bacterium]